MRDRDGRDGVALEVGQLRLERRRLEEASQHVPSVQENQLDVDVRGGLLDFSEIAALVGRDAAAWGAEVDADGADLPRRELCRELLGGRREQVVVEGDEDDVGALGEELLCQGLADS